MNQEPLGQEKTQARLASTNVWTQKEQCNVTATFECIRFITTVLYNPVYLLQNVPLF